MNTIQFGYLIHTRPYRESSLLAEFLTGDQGRITVVARGIRKNKSLRGLMRPFQRLRMSLHGRGELLSLGQLEADGPSVAINGLALFCGYYVNELVLKLLVPGEVCDVFFTQYEAVITDLARLSRSQQGPLEVCLREFEFCLLGELGKSLDFSTESSSGKAINAEQTYWVGLEQGISGDSVEDSVEIAGQTLIAIAGKNWHSGSLAGAKKINRFFIDRLLNTKILHTRKMIREYIEVMSEQNTPRG